MRFLRSLLLLCAILLLGVLITPSASQGRAAAPEAVAAGRPQGQASTMGGQIVQIGFDGKFQPTGWVPMKVSINPAGGESGQYLLRVHQRDLDGDEVIFQRSITLTGGIPQQEFWTYFKPQPVNALSQFDSASARQSLRVVLADADGRELAQLQLGEQPDPLYTTNQVGFSQSGLGKRLILAVSDEGPRFIGYDEYEKRVIGFTEEIMPVPVTPASLPDRDIGYDGVDTVVWQNADPAVLNAGGGERMAALRQWVRSGGKLVVTARSEWESLEPFFDLLPVTPTGAVGLRDLGPLEAIVLDGLGRSTTDRPALLRAWRDQPPGTEFRFIIGQARPDAIVERTFSYEPAMEPGGASSGEAPLLARRPEGFGSVTYLATDLSNANLRGRPANQNSGWSIIWDEVLGLGDEPLLDPRRDQAADLEPRETKDLGYALLPGSRLAGRSLALVTVALVFFVAYWLIAGPGLFFYLVARKRTPLSWYFFGAAAVIATFVTLGVVNLILRGPPDLRHVSVVRQGPVANQWVHTEMGLYIPEDGVQRIVLDEAAAGTLPTLTGFGIDPEQHQSQGGRSNPITYTVSLDPPDRGIRNVEGGASAVDIPYRSTLKKLEAGWTGPVARGIGGEPRLVPNSGLCEGRLSNLSGHDLVNVHIAFRYKSFSRDEVMIVFLPSWPRGQTLEGINTLLSPSDPNQRRIKQVARNASTLEAPPTSTDPVWGPLIRWSDYWYSYLRAGMIAPSVSSIVDDWPERVRRTPAMLSFFSLLPPMQKEQIGSGEPVRMLRRGAQELDVSAAVLAGNMVIVAEADEVPLPFPMEVDGDKVEGAGRIIYQFVLPLDRSEIARAEQEALRRQAEEQAQQQAATQPGGEPSKAVPAEQ